MPVIEIRGRYNTALCYTDALEETARRQILDMCGQRLFAGSRIRIMPDVHAGAGCTVGTTMTVADRVAPGLVGVDIGCGMETVKIGEKEIDFEELDRVIRAGIPSGENIRETPHPLTEQIDLRELRCFRAVDASRAALSLGTLGGGNHFIEIDRGEDGALYLIVHSGSRYLGVQTASYYRKLGWKAMNRVPEEARQALIARCRAEGRVRDIERGLRELKSRFAGTDVPERFADVEGRAMRDYIHDMGLFQRYAALNRRAMTQTILDGLGLTEVDRFTTVHNYIDTKSMILRKGAVSARKGERLLIPVNMRDGSLICVGKGDPEWNFSAPHGAGRLMSRTAARNALTVEEFRREMRGVYTTCVARSTLDESPMAYKALDEILAQIGPAVEVVRRLRPLYNFKACERM